LCLAWGLNAGIRRRFKATILSTRTTFPPLLVRYVGDERGRKNPLLMPDVPTAHLRTSEVMPWREPTPVSVVEADRGCEGEEGEADTALPPSEAPTAQRKSLRPSKQKPTFLDQLVTEAHGIALHLDPRRTSPGYAGTGYKGVFDDYWPSGFKRDKPYTVQHDGKYQGRFALVIEAALHYAQLELGIARSREERKDEQQKEKQHQRGQRQKQLSAWPSHRPRARGPEPTTEQRLPARQTPSHRG